MSVPPRRPTVLVIDDEPFVVRLLEEYLPRVGFGVQVASSGPEGLELYSCWKELISLVLLDIELPLMDGPTTLAALRQIDPEVRCCFMSGFTRYRRDQLAAMGAIGFIEKPFRLETLAETLKTMLGKEESSAGG